MLHDADELPTYIKICRPFPKLELVALRKPGTQLLLDLDT